MPGAPRAGSDQVFARPGGSREQRLRFLFTAGGSAPPKVVTDTTRTDYFVTAGH